MDILQSTGKGPADIFLSEGRIRFKNSRFEIPCMQITSSETTRKVRSADDFLIPGLCEAVIDVYIDRNGKDESDLLIEPTRYFKENSPLLMAPCVVNVEGNVTAQIRVMNPFQTDANIKQDSIIGEANDFACLQTLAQPESMQDSRT
jgi:hypothetical protein